MTEHDSNQPEVETRQVVRWITDPTTLQQTASQPDPLERPVRPLLRPKVPVLTALDDGTFATGEDFRLRGDRFRIGRTEGDFTVPSDRTLSGKHAEIRRVENRGQFSWVLVDLDTANGTFVRANAATFFADTIVILGGRRYRLSHPYDDLKLEGGASTTMLDKRAAPADLCPMLTETGTAATALKFPIQASEVTVGRLGGGSGISIDDPHLAKHHAKITRSPEGVWRIRAGQTENGVWANIRSVALTSHCYFRCGEQCFRFVIP